MGDVITQEQADEMFSDELAKRAPRVIALLGTSPTSQPQFDALLSFAYNAGHGQGGLATSGLLRAHLAGDHLKAKHQFARWRFQKGKVLRGLIRRRAYEAALYATPEGANPPWLHHRLSGEPFILENWA
jgi:GH24 family phage-related lysozyme (muramidase)